jgi:hypothetical protein
MLLLLLLLLHLLLLLLAQCRAKLAAVCVAAGAAPADHWQPPQQQHCTHKPQEHAAGKRQSATQLRVATPVLSFCWQAKALRL